MDTLFDVDGHRFPQQRSAMHSTGPHRVRILCQACEHELVYPKAERQHIPVSAMPRNCWADLENALFGWRGIQLDTRCTDSP
jgi:hypothetical protein